MAKIVIKKDGSEEEFDTEKIKKSIKKAAEEAGLEPEKINELVEKVSSKAVKMAEEVEEKIASSQIRENILSTLDEVEDSVSQAWRDYDKTYKS